MTRADAALFIVIVACVAILLAMAVDELRARWLRRKAQRDWIRQALAATTTSPAPPATYAFHCDHCGAEVRKPITGLFSLAWICAKCQSVYSVKAEA